MLCLPAIFYAQEKDKNKALQENVNQDDLGNVSDEFQEYFFEALAQKAIENYEKAIIALEKCRKLRPEEVSVYFELGKNHLQLEQYAEAEVNFKKALDLKQNDEAILTRLYEVYYETNNYAKAIKTADKLKGFSANYYEDLANLYIRTKEYKKALSALDKMDELRGQSAYREKLRRQIFQENGDKAGQEDYLKQKIADYPERVQNYVNLIYFYSENDQLDKAFRIAKNLQKQKPNAEEAHLALYKMYLKQEKYEKAVSSMKTVLKSDIDNTIKEQVIKDFTELVKRKPQFEPALVETLDNQGRTDEKSNRQLAEYYRGKDNAKSLSYFEKALEENPNDFKLIKETLLLQIDGQKFQKALDLSSKTMAYFPAQALIYLIQGVAHNGLGEFQPAI